MDITAIKQVLTDQREELDNMAGKTDRIIERDVLAGYRKLLGSRLIKVIIGPRRAGKSVLGSQLLSGENFAYVNFDDERLLHLEAKDLNSILQAILELFNRPDFIFLDEIQNVDGWELFVNRLHRSGYNILVTGSNAKLLSTEMATHLTGRCIVLQLYPFSFREYLRFNRFGYNKKHFSTADIAAIRKHLENYVTSGSFPEVVQGEDPRKYLLSLYSTVLTKDVVLRYNIRHKKTLREISGYITSNPGRKFTFNRIMNAFGLKSVHTAKNYFEYINESFLVFAISRFSAKSRERISAPRKVYSIDTGLANVLSGSLLDDMGHIYENAVAIELLRRKADNEDEDVYYWESPDNYQVDFVTKKGRKINSLIQVCYRMDDFNTKRREIRSLFAAEKKLRCKEMLIITSTDEGEEIMGKSRIKIVPLWRWLIHNT